jgi:hypothetical protein
MAIACCYIEEDWVAKRVNLFPLHYPYDIGPKVVHYIGNRMLFQTKAEYTVLQITRMIVSPVVSIRKAVTQLYYDRCTVCVCVCSFILRQS